MCLCSQFKIILIISLDLSFLEAYNILGIFPYTGKSHMDTFVPIFKGLARSGHNVTVISPYLSEDIPKQYKDISLDYELKIFMETFSMGDFRAYDIFSKYLILPFVKNFAGKSCEFGLNSRKLENFMRTNESFDIILIENFNSDCFMALANKFRCPIIGLSSCTLMPWTSARYGNPTHTAYIPNNLADYSDRMTFLQRLDNTVAAIVHRLFYHYVVIRNDKKIVREIFGKEASEFDTSEVASNLILVNSHFSLNLPRPLAPNVIEIGGVHIPEPTKLSKNLEKWISESKDGVIYFSLGSLIKGHTISKEKKDAFLKAFSRLPQRVLWKWENETMEGKPDNVMIQKWMPQFDILSHPNVKVFISHGGLLGTMEAVHCGVPIIVMPQFGDQPTNAKAIEANGGGVILPLSEVTEETAYKALKTVLSSSFREKAKQLSERFRDRPLSPLDTAIYWVEYVARHKGAPHMRTAAVDMPFYQYYLLDVFGFIFAVIAAFIYAIYFICKLILRKCINNVKLKQS